MVEQPCFICGVELCPAESFGPGYVTVVPGIDICEGCLED